MAHNIFGERFIAARQPAWHGLGTTFENPISAVEAIETAGLDYAITKIPLHYEWNGVMTPTGEVAIVRAPTPDDDQPRVLGSAGKDYGLIQNRELAEILDASLTAIMPVETVGALGLGETIFVCLDNGLDEVVPGETVHNYFLVTDTRSGNAAMQIAYTPVRVVCQNTLRLGLSQATVKWAVAHNADMKLEVEAQTRILGQLKQAKEKSLAIMQAMATTKIVEAQVDAILALAYPMPAYPAWVTRVKSLDELEVTLSPADVARLAHTTGQTDNLRGHIESYRVGAKGLYAKFNDEFPSVAQTPWAVYNAIVETEDYREGRESAPESALFGSRAQTKRLAFKASSALVGARN